jgi:uncharacterized protein YjiS (DUF1127 family)
MSIMLLERSAAGQSAWRAAMERAAGAFAEFRRQQKARRDRKHLMQLPDYLLRDIGLSRLDVARMDGGAGARRSFVLPDISWRLRP